MEDPLEIAQQQADEAIERTTRLRKVFLSQGVQQYIREIVNEHKQRQVGGSAGAPSPSRETENSG